MGDDPMALKGMEGALKDYYYYYNCSMGQLSDLLSGLCPCGASVRGRGFGHFASTQV